MPPDERWKALERVISSLNSQISLQRGEVLGGDVEKRLYENMNNLKKLADWYFRYREIKKAILIFERQITSMQLIAEEFVVTP